MKTYVHLRYLAEFFLERKMFRTKLLEQIKTHILQPILFFFKSCPLSGNVEKFCRTGQATDENMVHVHYFEHALRICITHCFSTATLVARIMLPLHLHCLPCYIS